MDKSSKTIIVRKGTCTRKRMTLFNGQLLSTNKENLKII